MSKRKRQNKKHTGQTEPLKPQNRPTQKRKQKANRGESAPPLPPTTGSSSPSSQTNQIPLAERNRMEAEAYRQQQQASGNREAGRSSARTGGQPTQAMPRTSPQTPAKQARETDKLTKSITPQAKKKERDQAKKANARRRHRRARRAQKGSYLLLLLFVLASGVVLSVTVFFNIDSVTVSPGSPYTAAEFMQAMGVQEGDNLWRLQTEQLAADFLAQKTDLDAVKIRRQFPNTLLVTMTPAEEQWRILEGAQYYSVSRGGRLLGPVDDYPAVAEGEPGPIILGGISVAERKVGEFLTEVEEYQTLMKVWAASLEEEIDGVTGIFLEGGNLSLGVEWRILAKLGGLSELSYKLSMLQYLREHQIAATEYGVLDLYLPRKGYFEQMTKEELYEKFPHLKPPPQ